MSVSNEQFLNTVIRSDTGDLVQLLKALLDEEEDFSSVGADTLMHRVEGVAAVLQQVVPEFAEVAHKQPHIQMMWLAVQLRFGLQSIQDLVRNQLLSGVEVTDGR